MRTIETVRLDEFLSGPVDLLKVEAEGAEPEVIQGASNLEVDTVVVDVSPERNGDSPLELCRSMLQDQGFETRVHGEILVGE